jgi:hypothetical protein
MNALGQLTAGLPPEDAKAANDVIEGLCRLAACGALQPESLDLIMGTIADDMADAWLARCGVKEVAG